MYKKLTLCLFLALVLCVTQAEAQYRNWYLLPYRANVANGGHCFGTSGMVMMPTQQMMMIPTQQFSTGAAQISLGSMATPSQSLQYNLTTSSGFQNQLNFDNPVASNGLFGGSRNGLLGGGNSVELVRIASCLACKILSNGGGVGDNNGRNGLQPGEIDVNAQLSPKQQVNDKCQLAELEERVANLEKNMLTKDVLIEELNKRFPSTEELKPRAGQEHLKVAPPEPK